MEKLTVTVKELAEMLNIGKNHAYELVKIEGFPVIKFGKRIVIPIDALKEWLTRKGFEKLEI